jgi:hypothetical protein
MLVELRISLAHILADRRAARRVALSRPNELELLAT